MRKVISIAPGKVILHGEYAVVFDKHAIATTVGLKTTVEIEVGDESNEVSLELKSFDQLFTWPLAKLQTLLFPDSGEGVIELNNDIKELIEKLTSPFQDVASSDAINSANAFLFLLIGISQHHSSSFKEALKVTVDSEFPVGAGLGSSAAFSVSLTGAIFEALKCDTSDKQLISDWSYQCERMFHGKPSGIDNSICTFGGTLLFKQGKILEHLQSPPQLKTLLVYTNVRRNTKALVESVVKRRETFPDVISQIMGAIDSISQSMWTLLKKGQVHPGSLNSLAEMNHSLLTALGAGHSSIDAVVQTAKRHNCIAKLTGAGGGGCVIVHLRPEMTESDITGLQAELEKQDFSCWSVTLGQGGLRIS
ncbi:Mevalonate kinase [Halotydeus destructor]|nr:Mevalonate kinase [Halotydeus destructor]